MCLVPGETARSTIFNLGYPITSPVQSYSINYDTKDERINIMHWAYRNINFCLSVDHNNLLFSISWLTLTQHYHSFAEYFSLNGDTTGDVRHGSFQPWFTIKMDLNKTFYFLPSSCTRNHQVPYSNYSIYILESLVVDHLS